MSRIHPLYLLLLSIIFAAFMAHLYHKEAATLKALQQEYKQKELLALRLRTLRSIYSPSQAKRILRLLHSAKIRQSGISYKEQRDRLVLSGKRVDPKAASLLVSKLLSQNYILKELALKRSKEALALRLEIAWQ